MKVKNTKQSKTKNTGLRGKIYDFPVRDETISVSVFMKIFLSISLENV